MPDTRDHPLPIHLYPVVFCCHCSAGLQVVSYVTGVVPIRYTVEHPDMPVSLIEQNTELWWCPNNARSWEIEPYQPKIYPVDPVTGEIDEMGGMV